LTKGKAKGKVEDMNDILQNFQWISRGIAGKKYKERLQQRGVREKRLAAKQNRVQFVMDCREKGMTFSQIAKAMNRSVSTVTSLRNRAVWRKIT